MAAFKQWEVPKYNFEEAEHDFDFAARRKAYSREAILKVFDKGCDRKIFIKKCQKKEGKLVGRMRNFFTNWFLTPSKPKCFNPEEKKPPKTTVTLGDPIYKRYLPEATKDDINKLIIFFNKGGGQASWNMTTRFKFWLNDHAVDNKTIDDYMSEWLENELKWAERDALSTAAKAAEAEAEEAEQKKQANKILAKFQTIKENYESRSKTIEDDFLNEYKAAQNSVANGRTLDEKQIVAFTIDLLSKCDKLIVYLNTNTFLDSEDDDYEFITKYDGEHGTHGMNLIAKRTDIKESYVETKAAEEKFKEHCTEVLKLNEITGEPGRKRKAFMKRRKQLIEKIEDAETKAAAKAAKAKAEEEKRKKNCAEGGGKTC